VTLPLPDNVTVPEGVNVISFDDWLEMPGALWGPGSRIDKMRILAVTPAHPAYTIKPQTWQSIQAAFAAHDGPVDWIFTTGDNPHKVGYENVTHHHNKARAIALAGGYDAILSIEADMIIPPDTINRLIACDSDIAYGLYVFRHKLHRWSAYTELGLFGGWSVSVDRDLSREKWGQVMDVAGVGMGCTLIRRPVFEKLEFRLYDGRDDWIQEEHAERMRKHLPAIDPKRPRTSMLCDDWMLAMEAQHYGFSQRCDLGLVCGHVDDTGVLWPDIDKPEMFRVEDVG